MSDMRLLDTANKSSLTEDQIRLRLGSRWWRLNNLYHIKDDKGQKIIFRMNDAQKKLYTSMHYYNVILKARQLGFCLDPSSKVLTADLRWKRIDSLAVGEEVVAVDEHPPSGRGKSRKMRTATIQGVVEVFRKAYKINFDDGTSVTCTGQHPWLCRIPKMTDTKWMNILGSEGLSQIKIGTKIRKFSDMWDDSQSYEGGWYGGVLDGEGSISSAPRSGAAINVSQQGGDVWERAKTYLDRRGYNYRVEIDKREAGSSSKLGSQVIYKAVISRMDEMMRLIGTTRPTRFLGNKFWEGKELSGKHTTDNVWKTVISIDELEEQKMIDLQTSTGTYIAEGLVSHNTTFIMIYLLDSCLFNDMHSAGVIAHTREAAEDLFRNKIRFAYDSLPVWLKEEVSAKTDSARVMEFNNGSSIVVGTSLRSGNFQKLHISEYGKTSVREPEKAIEIKTGALNAIHVGQQVFIESTAEGQGGEFFNIVERARIIADNKSELTPIDPKFHFFPWYEDPKYNLSEADAGNVSLTDADIIYFEKLGVDLTAGQKAWYVKKKEQQGDAMLREFPSSPDEAFRATTEGAIYKADMMRCREEGRICSVPYEAAKPVFTFWDLGDRDPAAVWFFQHIGMEYRFIDYWEGSDVGGLPTWVRILRSKPYIYGTHFWPHDGGNRQSGTGKLLKDMGEELGLRPIKIVPRTKDKQVSIEKVRPILGRAYFDKDKCSKGIMNLESYRREWDVKLGVFKLDPKHDSACHSADALMTFADGYDGRKVEMIDFNERQEYAEHDYDILGGY